MLRVIYRTGGYLPGVPNDPSVPANVPPQNLAAYQVVPDVVPDKVPLWRLRAVAAMGGLTAEIEGALASLPEPQKTVASQAWEYGMEIERASSLLSTLVALIPSLTEERVDELFIQADQLPV